MLNKTKLYNLFFIFYKKMFIIDIETSGLDELKHGIVEIGAIKYENPEIFYHSLSRLDEEDEIDDNALKINGQTREQVRDINRPTQKQILIELYELLQRENDFYAAGENVVSFDLRFIRAKAKKYGLKDLFQYRSYDLHSIASLKYEQIFGNLPLKDGKTELGLSKILEFVGLKDERKKHNALEDCKLEAEAISRIRSSKNLFPEYSQYPTPDYLKK